MSSDEDRAKEILKGFKLYPLSVADRDKLDESARRRERQGAVAGHRGPLRPWGGTRSSRPKEDPEVQGGVQRAELLLLGKTGEVPAGAEGVLQRPVSRRVVLRVRLRHPQLHQHVAVADRSRSRVPDDASQRSHRERDHRDQVLRRRPPRQHLQGPPLLRLSPEPCLLPPCGPPVNP
ncbi:unnamed protein product [Tetraodon nigroviridis]|uniref:(spotted green pufferfish) hypothetical protein n=1 Tax=Tetraodon nigroviridis TaxID=99883 RepID=Q4SRW3_TETNG|nr:unnamed protein product [Tetraodon nigroviridis]